MHTVQNTLYVMTPQAYAHLENSTLRIDVEHEKEASPAQLSGERAVSAVSSTR